MCALLQIVFGTIIQCVTYSSPLCALPTDSTPRRSTRTPTPTPSEISSSFDEPQQMPPEVAEVVKHYPMRLKDNFKRACFGCKLGGITNEGSTRNDTAKPRIEYQKSNLGCWPCRAVYCSHSCWAFKHETHPEEVDTVPLDRFEGMSRRRYVGQSSVST